MAVVNVPATVDDVLGTVALIGAVDVVDNVEVIGVVDVVDVVDTVAEPGTVAEPETVELVDGNNDVVVVAGIVVPGIVVPTTTELGDPATVVELATGPDTTGTTGMVEGNVDATTVVGGDDGTGANNRGNVTIGATATTPPDGLRQTVPRCPISGSGCPPNTTGSSPLDNPPPTGNGVTTG